MRALEGDESAYLVDENGNTYDAYSLAWRYLGLYIDCDVETGDYYGGCTRKVLWAAVGTTMRQNPKVSTQIILLVPRS